MLMDAQAAKLFKSDQDHLIHPMHHPSDLGDPLIIVKGRGATIVDIAGREYIDGLSGLWNINVGHGREELAGTAAAQMGELAFYSAYAGYSNVPAIKLAEKLISLAYPNMQSVFFTCGGAEANESAFKTARFYWKAKSKPGKVKIITRFNAYHGVTLQAMSATGMTPFWKMFEPRLPEFVHIPTCYPYRQEGSKPGETVGQTAARLLEEAILREGAETVAAFVAEPIHGAGGVIYPGDDYFALVRKICDRHQILFIADEIITAFCRTGRWFALTHWNVLPDIVAFAKGVSSGYLPLGGIMVSKAIKEAMDSVGPDHRGMHGFTYSGHPTCCAVGLKNIEIMEREGLGERAAVLGNRLHQGLHAAFGSHPNLGDIRSGKGLLAAIELVEDKPAKKPFSVEQKVGPRILQEMRKRGLVTRARGESIFFAPPLVISEEELDRMVAITSDAVKAVTGA
jgi:adenosylmethionine-8-amino-7-oxononanoate aminotransferase